MNYKKVLAAKIKDEQAFEEKQRKLRRQYGIHKNVVVVEKANTVKFLIKAVTGMVRAAASIALLGLAVIGIVAIVYPEPRSQLIILYQNVITQLIVLLGA